MLGSQPFRGEVTFTWLNRSEVDLLHLRHLTTPKTLSKIASSRHGLPKQIARSISPTVSNYIARGLEFYSAIATSPRSVRPVLEYYAFLNFSVACVCISRPALANSTKSHGISDVSYKLNRVELGSTVATIKHGALSSFHSLFCERSLANTSLRLRDLIGAIPFISSEAESVFKIKPVKIVPVLNQVLNDDNRATLGFRADSSFGQYTTLGGTALKSRIEEYFPSLQTDFVLTTTGKHTVLYNSASTWPKNSDTDFLNFVGKWNLLLTNPLSVDIYKSGTISNPTYQSESSWFLYKRSPILPTPTACLALYFWLSSLFRYRADLIESIDPPIRLLIETFAAEARLRMLSMFRNLLYMENLIVEFETHR